MKRMSEIRIIMVSVIIALAISTCSKKEEAAEPIGNDAAQSVVSAPKTPKDSIYAIIDMAMTRLQYRDKSGLYELEFDYLKDDETFDEYIKHGEVSYAEADSLTHFVINDVVYFGNDSASVNVTFHFKGPLGKESFLTYDLITYRYKGRWAKPTVSTIFHEQQYQNIINQAESAAAAEQESNGR